MFKTNEYLKFPILQKRFLNEFEMQSFSSFLPFRNENCYSSHIFECFLTHSRRDSIFWCHHVSHFFDGKEKASLFLVVLGYRKDATFMTSSLPAPPEKKVNLTA